MEPQPEFVISVSKYFNDICRLCLKQSKLETLQNSQSNISSRVLNFVEGSLIYKLPEKICEQCLSFLTQITSFINKCKHSQNILKQIEGECDLIKPSNELQVDILDDPDSTNELPIDCHSNDSDIEIKDEKLIAPDHLDYINEKPFDGREKNVENNVTANILDHLDYIKKESDDSNKNLELNIPAKQKKPKKKQIPQNKSIKNVLKICAKCGEAVPILRDHYKISKSCYPRNYRCKECGLAFRKSSDLEIHKSVRHLNETHMCHVCSRTYRYKDNLRRHLEAHENPKQFVCETCGKAYTTKCHLEEHKNSHTGEKPFQCSYCDKSYSMRSSRFIHERQHLKEVDSISETDDVPQTCEICNKVFSNERGLKIHRESHNENRIFKCSMCGKEYPSKLLLSRHFVVHSDEKRHPCSQCGKRFTQRESLTRHLRTHTGERPYPCTFCSKRFIQETHLSYHMLLHKGDKSFGCQFCGKLFTQKSTLTVHLRIHTGERPYQCHVCKQGFCDSSSRKRHVLSKHGVGQVKLIQNGDVINKDMC